MGTYRDPAAWAFNEQDREAAARPSGPGRAAPFWKVPVRLIRDGGDEPGLLAVLWRLPTAGTKGGGAAASILPVLATHTWPDAKHLTPNGMPAPGWPPWAYLSRRRVAALAGLNKDTVTTALRHLEAADLVAMRSVAPPPGVGGPALVQYSLAPRFYPTERQRYAEFPKRLLYGGAWAALPTNASRQLYLAIACADPVLNEAYYLEMVEYDRGDDKEAGDLLGERRAAVTLSLSALQRLTGIQSRGEVIRARRILTTPLYRTADGMPATIPLVDERPGAHGAASFAPNRSAWDRWFEPEWLNSHMGALRAQMWPGLAIAHTATGRGTKRAA